MEAKPSYPDWASFLPPEVPEIKTNDRIEHATDYRTHPNYKLIPGLKVRYDIDVNVWLHILYSLL